MTSTHKVGDVVYVIKKKLATVVPMRIVEINTKQSIEGQLITYVGQCVTGELHDPYKAGDEVHISPESAYVSLVAQFEASIKRIVDEAAAKAEKAWPTDEPDAYK